MDSNEFRAQVDAVGRSAISMDTVRIIFTDGESHVVQTWTIWERDADVVEYLDVHMEVNAPKIRMPYRVIARVEPYDQRKQTP